MINKPLVTVIIPSYNSSAFIGRCIDSIVEQTFSSYEVLIVDGLSTDHSLEIIESICSKNPNIKFITESDKGIYDAMNKGLTKANGEWLLFLGADDKLYNKDVLQDISEYLKSPNANFIYGNVKIVGDVIWANDGEIYDGMFSLEKLTKKNICHQSIFYRRSLFQKLGLFNIKYRITADWDFNHRCFALDSVKYVDQIISFFFAGGESSQFEETDQFTGHDVVFNLRTYYKKSFLDKFYRPYSWVFYGLSKIELKKKEYLRSIYFLFFSVVHADRKISVLSNYFKSMRKQFKLSETQ